MKNGGMQKIVTTTAHEKELSKELSKIDDLLLNLRDKVRHGEIIEDIQLKGLTG